MQIVSAATETFLLERSRLVFAGADERNYHVFYMLLSSLESVSNSLSLTVPTDYNILNVGACTTLPEEGADERAFKELVDSFRDLHFSESDVNNIWRTLGVILHLGNFKLIGNDDGAEVQLEAPPAASLELVASWLGVEPVLFKSSMTTSLVVVGNRASVNVKILSFVEVDNNLKGLMKWI